MSPVPAVSPERFASFGQLLKFLRRRAGLTQRELSNAVGYDHTQISRFEQDERAPDRATLLARFPPALQIEHDPKWLTRLLELAAALRPDDAPAADAPQAHAHPHNLPAQFTSFVGREKEVAQLRRLLSIQRLVTITGPGGVGKTRLALQVAADRLADFPDGAWWADLAAIPNPTLVPQAIESALDVREEPGYRTLADHLGPKPLLLILDNCEHLITACAQLAEALLQACPALKILATSREGLGIAGEASFPLPSLSLPDVDPLPTVEKLIDYEAVRLFVDRAAAALPGFRLTEHNALAVAQVCHRLDGIPLAIELAAARVKMLTVQQISARLDDRFRLLTGGRRTALPRHQTLSALIGWSYELLSEPERVLFRRLSVFSAGWTLEAAEAVCQDDGGRRKDEGNRLYQIECEKSPLCSQEPVIV